MDNGLQVLPLIAAIIVLLATMVIGLAAARKTRTLSDYWVAGRGVDVFTNASAISSNYLSAASFLGVAAIVWASGFDGVWYATGFAAGYILLLLFIASPLRRFGQYTIPDFCHGRFQSSRLRRVGILWTVVISALYIIAQMVGVGTVMEAIVPSLSWELGVIVLGGVITLYVAFGGMTGVTITQMMQFWIMLTAMLVPLFVLMPKHSYGELLRMAYADVRMAPELEQLPEGEPGHVPQTVRGTPAFSDTEAATFPDARSWVGPFKKFNLFSSISLLIALVCGTAGLPHILARFYTNPNAAKARWSTVWVLIFIGIFYILTPVWGTYARMVLGPEAVLYNANGEPNPNTMMFLTSADAGDWAKALVAAGATAALLSTVSGLLIALSSAFAHDFYGETLRPDASDREKIVAAKVAVVGFGALAIAVGLMFRDQNVAWMVGLAFAVAASTFFPLLTCGIWWRRMTEAGAMAGIMVGGLISAAVVFGKLFGAWEFEQPAVISVPLAFLAIFVVSKMTYNTLPETRHAELDASFRALHDPETDRRQAAEAAAAVAAAEAESTDAS